MTDRITAALEAADKATPGPWVIYDLTGVATKSNIGIAECWVRKDWDTEANATLIAAAPDMASEIVKLRKWQSEAADYLGEARAYYADKAELWKGRDREKQYQLHVDVIDRLIAEAKETQE